MNSDFVKIGQRVLINAKDAYGVIAYIGVTDFSPGKWIGLTLDEPKGKNNGTVQGKQYFVCDDNYGMFVRQTQISAVNEESAGTPSKTAKTTSAMASRSKLPIPPSSGGSAGTGSRQPSFSKINRGRTTPTSGNLSKERSFIESRKSTGLDTSKNLSNIDLAHSAGTPDRIEEKINNLRLQKELSHAKDDIKDLEEKLETLKVKRAKDHEKLKEYDKTLIQCEQLREFKVRIMESQSLLQKELQNARHEARLAIEAREAHAVEMRELTETMEMSTLDREMAEEKAEVLQIELEALKERNEELALDLDILKAEAGGGDGSAGVSSFELTQVKAQNEKLRETLGRMRDLSVYEKGEMIRLGKQLENSNLQLKEATSQAESYAKDNEQFKEVISDLQEQVDAALGAEEMVENLTTKCLDLEDKVAVMLDEKHDHETLHEMNEELHESAKEMEIELREELSQLKSIIVKLNRDKEVSQEVINDHEITIRKFRDFVNEIQEQNADLRQSLDKQINQPVTTPADLMDFKKMFADSKAQSKAIDLELRACQLKQATQHVEYVLMYMNDSFLNVGGDNEAILVLLLIPRIAYKVTILINQIRESSSHEDIIVTFKPDRQSIIKDLSIMERLVFGLHISHKLLSLCATLHRIQEALESMSPPEFLQAGLLYSEMGGKEVSIDFYVQLQRNAQLDENTPLESLDKCITYFKSVQASKFDPNLLKIVGSHNAMLADHILLYTAALDTCYTNACLCQCLLLDASSSIEIGTFLKFFETYSIQMKALVKSIKRRTHRPSNSAMFQDDAPSSSSLSMLKEASSFKFSFEDLIKLTDVDKKLNLCAQVLYKLSRSAIQQCGIVSAHDAGISELKFIEILQALIMEFGSLDESDLSTAGQLKGLFEWCHETLLEIDKCIQDGEWEISSPVITSSTKCCQSIVKRAAAYKAELEEAENMIYKLESKDHEIKDLRRLLKLKAEELSEAGVRRDLAEKRSLDVSRESELVIEKLQRKLNDAIILSDRKKKEFETTLEALNCDISSLQMEKGVLKQKWTEDKKRCLIEGLSRGVNNDRTTSEETGSSQGISIPSPVRDSPMLLQRIQDLQSALSYYQMNSNLREGDDINRRLAALKPLKGMNISEDSVADRRQLNSLNKQIHDLQHDAHRALIAAADVIDISGLKPRLSNNAEKSFRTQSLMRRAESIALEISRIKASRTPGGQITTSFSTIFSTPLMGRVLTEKDSKKFGKISFNIDSNEDPKIYRVEMATQELRNIHQKLMK